MSEGDLVGAPLSAIVALDQLDGAAIQLRAMSEGSVSSMDAETQAIRADKTTMWLHWSATAGRK
jgi:hypothetical protein